MASILITDTPITKALEEQNSKDFEALWDILKIGTVRGYITPNDLQQLEQHLYDSVGEAFAQKLLAGFRSVLGIYGEPDHPSIDLIIDGESVDELADEIPIRSVSDFLCIYELERLFATGSGEEILEHSLFSSLSDILEVLDGEDAFVSKALMDAIVPVDDASTLASSSHLSSAGTIAISSNATTEEETALENSQLTDGFVNADGESDPLPLSPVIQAILNSGNPSDSSKLDLRFGPERADARELLTHGLITPTHTSQSIYDVNVDMFLILGLIMQMAEKDEHGLERNSTVQKTLLTRKTTLSHPNPLTNGGANVPSETPNSLPMSMESEGLGKPTELILDDLVPSEIVQTHPPFHHQKSDRQVDLNVLSDGHYKTTAKNALGPGEKVHPPSPNSSASSNAPEPTGQPQAPVSHLEEPSTQTSPSSDSLDESRRNHQSSGFQRSTVLQFSGESDSSITQMDPMLSGDQQPLTSPMVKVKDTSNNIRSLSNSTVTETSAYHLKNTLKFINERKKAANERGANPFGQSDQQTPPRPTPATTTTTDQSNDASSTLSDKSPTGQLPRSALAPPLGKGQEDANNEHGDRPIPLSPESISDQDNILPIASPSVSPPIVPASSTDVPQDDVLPDGVFFGSATEDDTVLDLQVDTITKNDDGDEIILAYDGSDLILTSPKADFIDTYGSANTIDSGRGGDDIYSVDGANTINSGRGNDAIYAVDGTDTIAGGRGGDHIVVKDSTTTVKGGKGNDYIDLYSVTNTIAKGGNGRDEIYINGANNTVNGGSGMDSIGVFGGTNTINSGPQGDSIYIRRGNNSIKAGQGADYIEIDGGRNSIKAGQGGDHIDLYGGNNSIEAGNGNDLIVIYGGTHTISGGNGQDLFVLEQNDDADTIPIADVAPDPEHVVITDFAQEQDTLELIDTAADDLKLEQVGLNTHIFAGDDLLAVLESVDRDNLLVTGAQIEDSSLGDLTFSIFIRWESNEIIQEFEQAESLVTTGEGIPDSGEDIFSGPLSDPWVKDIWLIDVSGDI